MNALIVASTFDTILSSANAWVQGSLWCLDELAEWLSMATLHLSVMWRVDPVQGEPCSQAATCNEQGFDLNRR